MTTPTTRAHWSSRLAFILAAAGSAIGLGNIWKFPYITGVNGGGAFVVVYLVCIATVGLPIFVAELFIGQTAQRNVVESFEVIDRRGSPWRFTGWMGLLSAVLILSFYSVVGGWVLDFILRSAANEFAHESDEQIKATLGALFNQPGRQLLWHAIFMGLTIGIVLQGLSKGVERWNKILMPGLFILILGLLVRALMLPGFGDAFRFLFAWDASKLSAQGILVAAGHSFFTLSLGMGAMITYGSYLKTREELVRTALWVCFLDTALALTAGLVIFSVVFSYGLEPGSGPTLMFQTLPMLFAKLPGGYLVSLAFFVLVAFAALTSAISLLEVVVTFWVERFGTSRRKVTLVAGTGIYAVGILSALSTNHLSEVKVLGLTFFDLFDKSTSNLLLPLGGALIALFFGWKVGPHAARSIVGPRFGWVAALLVWATRVISPLAVIAMILNGLFG